MIVAGQRMANSVWEGAGAEGFEVAECGCDKIWQPIIVVRQQLGDMAGIYLSDLYHCQAHHQFQKENH